MTYRVSSENKTYAFASDSKPVLTVKSGDEVVIETVDARGGRAMSRDAPYVVPPPPSYEKLNPVTGPVAVEGAKTGDSLAVEIQEIMLGSKGYTSIRDDEGVLKDLVSFNDAPVIQVENGRVRFNQSISFAVRPMIGTIGVAPAGRTASVYPGRHGGNMDCNEVRVGSTLYLPVRAEGALFALGDVHASMGDGETSGGGIDIGADIKVRLRVRKDIQVEGPIVETDSSILLLHNSPTLEGAFRGVLMRAVSLLQKTKGVKREEAIALVGVSGDLGICQAAMIPIDVTVKLKLPKELASFGVTG